MGRNSRAGLFLGSLCQLSAFFDPDLRFQYPEVEIPADEPHSEAHVSRTLGQAGPARPATRRRSACARTRTRSRSSTPPSAPRPQAPSHRRANADSVRMYAFCTRARPEGKPKSAQTALQSQADGGIRTLDPRFTREEWGVSLGLARYLPVRRTTCKSTTSGREGIDRRRLVWTAFFILMCPKCVRSEGVAARLFESPVAV